MQDLVWDAALAAPSRPISDKSTWVHRFPMLVDVFVRFDSLCSSGYTEGPAYRIQCLCRSHDRGCWQGFNSHQGNTGDVCHTCGIRRNPKAGVGWPLIAHSVWRFPNGKTIGRQSESRHGSEDFWQVGIKSNWGLPIRIISIVYGWIFPYKLLYDMPFWRRKGDRFLINLLESIDFRCWSMFSFVSFRASVYEKPGGFGNSTFGVSIMRKTR